MSRLARRNRRNFRIGIIQFDGNHFSCFVAVALEVDDFKDTLRKIVLPWRRQFRNQQVQEDGQLLPFHISVRQYRAEETISSYKGFCGTLKLDLIIRLKLVIDGCTGVKGGI